jgi:hypothetical protein
VREGIIMRRSIGLWTVILFLIVGMAVAISACGGGTSAGSSTTLGSTSTSSTTAASETTTTVPSETTSTSQAETTTTSEAATTTTEPAQTADSTDHAPDLRKAYPSTESFDNSTWATLNAAPANHIGAAVDVKGQAANVHVDPDSRYLNWSSPSLGRTAKR